MNLKAGPILTINLAVSFELRDNRFHSVDGNRKTKTDASLIGREDHCIHADHLTEAVDKRATTVTRIDRSIRLDHSTIDTPFLYTEVHFRGTHYANRNRWFVVDVEQTERISKRNHPLPGDDIIRVAQFDVWKILRIDLEQGNIGHQICPHTPGLVFFAVRHRHSDLFRSTRNMVVRENITIGRDDEPRAEALHLLCVCTVAEELAKERIVAEHA